MNLRSVSCTQFAGLRDTDVRFQSGINVIYGKNESGKSTLVNLISRTLFQNARIDGRSDKEFVDLYFPSAKRGSKTKGDFADGKLTFETHNGTYTLTKEWGADARCMLSTPDGIIRDAKTIEAVLREELVYGEGVYTHLLLSSQRATDAALQTLLDSAKKTDGKQDIADAVTMAAAECDGVSVDVIGQAIDAKIDELVGKHWDVELDRPVRKQGRWSAGLGEILKAYYALEDAKTVLEDIASLEREADRTAAVCAVADAQVSHAQTAFDTFRGFASTLVVCAERREKITRLETELAKLRDILEKWPACANALEKAFALQKEQQARRCLTRYAAASALVSEIGTLKTKLADMPCPCAEDVDTVRNALRRLQSLQNALCGMNLAAGIRMFGDHKVEVRSLRTGALLDVSAETLAITEAVTVTVDGVMEMQLSPANVDTAAITKEIAEQQQTADNVLQVFRVTTLEELEEASVRAADDRRTLETVSEKLRMLLGEQSFEALESEAKLCGDAVRSAEEIEQDIRVLCGGDVARFIAVTQTVVQGYEAEYGSVDSLKAKAFDTTMSLEKARTSLEATQAIPAEYAAIADPEAHLAQLQACLFDAQQRKEEALAAKTVAAGRLEGYKDRLEGDPAEMFDAAQRRLDEQKELLIHWMHIKEMFLAQKEQLGGNPMTELARRFADNLSILSASRLTTEFPDPDRLQMQIYTGDRAVDFAKLSEGTKETVSLSFRLAMLDHLFPEGGGVIVLDDPFANMDAGRTAQSCELLKDCATRHQIILLTCKEDYKTLGGQLIEL